MDLDAGFLEIPAIAGLISD